MKIEFNEIVSEVILYLVGAWMAINPFVLWVGSILAYILFPQETYMTYAMIVGLMVLGDLFSKYYAISVQNGGLWNALKSGYLSSHKMWVGTRRKIVSYFVVMILVGLSFRFEMLQTPAEFLATIAYSIMFFRESQSILENMIEAGHSDVTWLLFFLRKKESEAYKKAGVDDSELKNFEDKYNTGK